MLMRKTEEDLHLKICDYLRKNYPDVLFRTDFSSGMKMSPGQAVKHKKFQKSRAWPDLFIAKAKIVEHQVGIQPEDTVEYLLSGLFLELKAEGTQIYKKDGTLRKNKHIEEQAEMLKLLSQAGYRARFAIGYKQAIFEIQEYLGKPKPKKVEF